MEQKNREAYEKSFGRSLYGDFSKEMDSLTEAKKWENEPEYQHYTSSSYVEERNGKDRKVTIEKEMKNDGKLLKMKREENYNPDGSCQVT